MVITQIIPHRAKAVKRERRRGTPRSRFAVREDGERRGATGSYGGRPFRPPTRTNPNPVKGNCVWKGRWALYIRAKRIAIVFGTALVEGENSITKNTRLRKGVLLLYLGEENYYRTKQCCRGRLFAQRDTLHHAMWLHGSCRCRRLFLRTCRSTVGRLRLLRCPPWQSP